MLKSKEMAFDFVVLLLSFANRERIIKIIKDFRFEILINNENYYKFYKDIFDLKLMKGLIFIDETSNEEYLKEVEETKNNKIFYIGEKDINKFTKINPENENDIKKIRRAVISLKMLPLNSFLDIASGWEEKDIDDTSKHLFT